MKFGFLVFEGLQLLDLVGPLEVVNMWKLVNKDVQTVFIGGSAGLVDCGSNMSIDVDYTFAEAPQLDYLIIPGGHGRIRESQNADLLKFIRDQYQDCKVIASVCTGAFLLYHAGLLDKGESTTYWRALAELNKNQDLQLSEQRVVKSGKIWTAGGVSSGIDLTLALIEEIAGTKTAGQVQLLLEYFPAQKSYAGAEDIFSLPPYRDGTNPAEGKLPAYIRDYINTSTIAR